MTSGNMRWKSLVTVLLVGLLAAVFATPGSGSGSASQKTIKIGLVLPSLTNQAFTNIYNAAKLQAKLRKVTLQEGGTTATEQWLNACDTMVTSHVDVLAYDTLDGAGTSECIKQANSAGIKTMCVFACTTEGKQDAILNVDWFQNGQVIGAWLVKAMGYTGEVAFLGGTAGDAAARLEGNGFKSAVAKLCPKCKLVASVPTGETTDTSYTVALSVLTAHPHLGGVYGLNDDVALGILKAVEQNHLNKQVIISGNVGTCQGLSSLLQGGIAHTQLINLTAFGTAIIDNGIKLANGQKVGSVSVNPDSLDLKTAKAILSGKIKNPGAKAALQAAQRGCP